MVDQNSASWNPLISWLRRIESLQRAALVGAAFERIRLFLAQSNDRIDE